MIKIVIGTVSVITILYIIMDIKNKKHWTQKDNELDKALRSLDNYEELKCEVLKKNLRYIEDNSDLNMYIAVNHILNTGDEYIDKLLCDVDPIHYEMLMALE